MPNISEPGILLRGGFRRQRDIPERELLYVRAGIVYRVTLTEPLQRQLRVVLSTEQKLFVAALRRWHGVWCRGLRRLCARDRAEADGCGEERNEECRRVCD